MPVCGASLRREDDRLNPLNQLYFYLTEGCNLACRHCWLAPKLDAAGDRYPTLPVELFETAIREAKPLGLSAVKLTGGEPLLHPRITRSAGDRPAGRVGVDDRDQRRAVHAGDRRRDREIAPAVRLREHRRGGCGNPRGGARGDGIVPGGLSGGAQPGRRRHPAPDYLHGDA